LSEASTQAKRKRALKPSRKSERLETRPTVEQKILVQRAATLQGRSLTDFMLTSVQQAAEQTIREHDVITLSARDSAAFMDALLHPQPAGRRLREAATRYKALHGRRLTAPPEAQAAVELLSSHHDRATFSCGAPSLDAYIQVQARRDAQR